MEIGTPPPEVRERHLLTRCFVRAGDRLTAISNGNEMRAVVVAFAEDREEAVTAADALAAQLTIRTTPLPEATA